MTTLFQMRYLFLALLVAGVSLLFYFTVTRDA